MEERILVENGDTITLGSSAECTITLVGHGIAEVHAEFTRSEDQWVVIDLGAPQGTVVNGTRTTEHTLAPGDLITIGAAQFRVEGDDIVRVPHEGMDEPILRLSPTGGDPVSTPPPQPTGASTRNRKPLAIAAALAASLVLLIGGAFAYSNHQQQLKKERAAAQVAAAELARQEAQERREAARVACEQEVSEALQALRGIQNNVDVGVNYSSYEPLVVDAAKSVGSLDVQSDPDCQAVVTNLKKAFKQYGKAGNIWNDVIYDDVGSTDELQGPWLMAGTYLTEAENTLKNWPTEPNSL